MSCLEPKHHRGELFFGEDQFGHGLGNPLKCSH